MSDQDKPASAVNPRIGWTSADEVTIDDSEAYGDPFDIRPQGADTGEEDEPPSRFAYTKGDRLIIDNSKATGAPLDLRPRDD